MAFKEIDWGMPPNDVPVSNTVQSGPLLFTAQVPRNPETLLPEATGGITEQTTRTLNQLKQVVEAADGTMADICQVQIFLVNRDDMDSVNDVYSTFFSKPYPNRATVVVKDLILKGALIEIVAYASFAQAD